MTHMTKAKIKSHKRNQTMNKSKNKTVNNTQPANEISHIIVLLKLNNYKQHITNVKSKTINNLQL